MRNREMKRMRTMLKRLSGHQRKVLAADLTAIEMQPAAVAVVESHAAPQACPHCSAERVVKNGTSGGYQRFLCRGCGKTFNVLTGTPLAHLHKRGRWLDHSAALTEGLTLHAVSERVGIAVSTAHRWRHRFLEAAKSAKAQALTGIAEADETYFLRSAKGQRRGLNRPARQRGGTAGKRGLSDEQVPVLVARDRSGETADFILDADTSDCASAVLKPIMAKDAILCTESNSVMMATARKLKVEHRPVNVSSGVRVDGAWHVQNVNSYHARLKEWMRRFKGVATKYLAAYLGWFRALDRSPAGSPKPAQWLAMAVTR